MAKKESNFFEEHIEKIILIATGVVCMWLSMKFVIFSPTKVTYDKREFSPSQIDAYIYDEYGKELEYRLSEKPSSVDVYESRKTEFEKLLASAIDIKTDVFLPVPWNLKETGFQPKYTLPEAGEIKDISADVISAVAYVPIKPITEESVYSQLVSEANDLDLVTVEAKLDVKSLYERYKKQFAGASIREQWRDESLAEPVFAAVHLERKQQLSDGSWSDWKDVPRSKIDSRREMFKIIEDVGELPPGGIKVRLLGFKDEQVQISLLQPEAYKIASADKEWFPPSLHRPYRTYQNELKRLQRIEARAIESTRRRTTGREGDSEQSLLEEMIRRGYSVTTTDTTTSTKINEVRKSIDELYDKFDKLLIGQDTDLSAIEEPLLIWAFDDTVEPKKKYRYRMRAGVFNPIAGTDKFANENDPNKDEVILWSNYAELKDVVEVPGRLYFFARDIQEEAKRVRVTVCRRRLGHWYSKDFMVRPGEVIGKAVELDKSKIQRDDEQLQYGGFQGTLIGMPPGMQWGTTIVTPEVVDYFTGAVLVDAVDVNDWAGGGNLYARYYKIMLYSYEGTKLERMPIKQRYWPVELRVLFGEIGDLEKEPQKPIRSWIERARGRGVRRRVAPRDREEPEGLDRETYMRMMMEQMQQMQRDRRR